MELIILTGIQAVGKSTFFQPPFCNTHIRINLDMLKTRHREQVFSECMPCRSTAFRHDNINVTRKERAH